MFLSPLLADGLEEVIRTMIQIADLTLRVVVISARDERKYYRFSKSENEGFPTQIELFARNSDLLNFDQDDHLTPIPLEMI